MDYNNTNYNDNMMYNQVDDTDAVRKTMQGVYSWMTVGLIVTAVVAMIVASNVNLLVAMSSTYWLWAILEFVVVLVFSMRAHKMSAVGAKISFICYAALNGLTLSFYFVVYGLGNVAYAFALTAGVFAVMTAFGYVTKIDLSKIGSLFVLALFGVIIVSIFTIFIPVTESFSTGLCYLTVFIFIGLIGYDTQKIKAYATVPNASIIGALELYLDFINIFIRLVRILAKNNR